MARFCTLFSGSKGNSFYIGCGDSAILIDAGRTAKQLENALKSNDLDVTKIKAIFVTHEHLDHIKGIKVFASRYNIKVYSSEGTMKALERMGILTDKFQHEVIGDNGVEVAQMRVVPFKTSHDSVDSVGYTIHTKDERKVVVATDIGYMSETVRNSIRGSDLAVIESNHDIRMLQNGVYPYYLKRRILSNTGHLSNEACARELPEFVKYGTTRFVLAHLSGENNLPELAYETSMCALKQAGLQKDVDFKLYVAPKENIGGKVIIF